ncbi:hypothetical protein OMCYN_01717 [cyanobiont of Ornithocercus magnificus]|nr:hypothetical protein OMCYN_01717 [cyanobiont of Ornithocercus magnificus]
MGNGGVGQGPGISCPPEFQNLLGETLPPVEYLRAVFTKYGEASLRYPKKFLVIANGARAIVDATNREYERQTLQDHLTQATKAPKSFIDEVMDTRGRDLSAPESTGLATLPPT